MSSRQKKKLKRPICVPRDISWLNFNERVLQEAADKSVPLRERIKFLGIFSNNLDEFFRVRVAALKRMMKYDAASVMQIEDSPQRILNEIQKIVITQQDLFNETWEGIVDELKRNHIHIVNETQLTRNQQKFVADFFESEVRSSIIPLMIENIPALPYLRDKSIYLAINMAPKMKPKENRYALIEVPAQTIPRFIEIPSSNNKDRYIILLEDIIRFCLPRIFSYFGVNKFSAHVIKVTRDAEYDVDYDEQTSYSEKIRKGIRDRRKGKPVRFIYDRDIDQGLLNFLIKKMELTKKDHLIPGGRIHNFRHFMDFPGHIFPKYPGRRKPFIHPLLKDSSRVTDVILKRDLLLHLPYHSFDPLIDLLREAAIDPDVISIKITAYRLASNSKIINALINAVRNGKKVTVMLELRARFEEERNLLWKQKLEDEGVKVLLGFPNQKVHFKACVIRRKTLNRYILYGFIGTGNLNEQTAKIYADSCLFTCNQQIMRDIGFLFDYLEKPLPDIQLLEKCKTLLVAPVTMRKQIRQLIQQEIRNVKKGKHAAITLKLNALSDDVLIEKLFMAAKAGVEIKLVIRGIFRPIVHQKKSDSQIFPISIVDEYLEHARFMVFHNDGDPQVYLSSADWMIRNLDHRVEAACPVHNPDLKKEIIDMLNIQLKDNVKARTLIHEHMNEYIRNRAKKIRSQIEIYRYLFPKALGIGDVEN